VGFRGSLQVQEWRKYLHHFFDASPAVEHYELVERGVSEISGGLSGGI
jgi:hypothetical protein